MANILIVEHEKAIQNLLSISLKQEGHRVYSAYSAIEGMDLIIKNLIDVVIFDVDIDSVMHIKAIKDYHDKMPVIVISSSDDELLKSKCNAVGVIKFIYKPISSSEIVTSVREALRCTHVGEENCAIFNNGPLSIDYVNHKVSINDQDIHFTNYEYKLLYVLSQNLGKTLGHDYLISKVWGAGGNDSNGLRVFMANIRRKIEKQTGKEMFRTEVGVGYRMMKL